MKTSMASPTGGLTSASRRPKKRANCVPYRVRLPDLAVGVAERDGTDGRPSSAFLRGLLRRTTLTAGAILSALALLPGSAAAARPPGKLVPTRGALFGAYVNPTMRWGGIGPGAAR
jgi:hypothetical protein